MILIDDLDRCSAEKVVSVLEAINVVMDVHGLIFVLALDYDVLTDAVRKRYEHLKEPHVFVEKMVQLPFRVPPLNIHGPTFLEELVPNVSTTLGELAPEVADSIVDIADYGLQRNPRQLKRLINAFLVTKRITDERRLPADEQMVLAMLGFQLRWPEPYRSVHAAVLSGADEPFAALLESNVDPGLATYDERFFAGREHLADEVRLIVEYTTALSVEPQPGVDPWDESL